jgi:hypothetical protein
MTRLTQLRYLTAAQWTDLNPVLRAGEPGIESDTQKTKYGDGSSDWNSLTYASGGAGGGGASAFTDLSDKITANIAGTNNSVKLVKDTADSAAAGASTAQTTAANAAAAAATAQATGSNAGTTAATAQATATAADTKATTALTNANSAVATATNAATAANSAVTTANNAAAVAAAAAAAVASKADQLNESAVSSSRNLTAADFGKILVNSSGSNVSLTLPAGLNPIVGALLGLKRTGSGTLTLIASGTNVRNLPGASVPQYETDFVIWSSGETYNYDAETPITGSAAPLTITSMQVPNGAPNTVILTMSRNVYGGLPGPTAFVVNVAAGARVTTGIALTDATHITLTFNGAAVTNGQAVTCAYTELTTGRVVSLDSGTPLANFGATAVTNNVGASVPAQVTGLTLNTPTTTTQPLTWTAPAGTPTDYLIEYKASASGIWLTYTDGVSTATTATVTGLIANTGYDYRVSAINAIGTGTASATATGNTAVGGSPPGQVTGLTLGTATSTTQPLSWTAPSGTPTDYIIEYKASSSGTWLTFADGTSTTVSTTVTGLLAATSYDYRVSAVNASGTGTVSATGTGSTAGGLTTDFPRLSSHSGATESGGSGAAWNYDATGDTACGVSDKSLTLAQDGAFEFTLRGAVGFSFFGLDETNTAQDPTSILYGMYSSSGDFIADEGGSVSVPMNRDDTLVPAVGNAGRYVCVGPTVLGQLKQGSVYTTMHRFPRARAETLFPGTRAFAAPTGWSITRTLGLVLGPKWTDGLTKVTIDGNSLSANDDGRSGIGTLLLDLSPLVGSNTPVANVAVVNQTIRMMNGLDGGSAADFDAAFDASKTNNIGILWEGLNSILAGRTYTQAATDLGDLIAARRATHPSWKFMAVTTAPCAGNSADQTARNVLNTALKNFNDYIIANRVALGIDVVCDIRQAGSIFDFAGDYSVAKFDACPADWAEGSGLQVHFGYRGHRVVAEYIAASLNTMGIT